MEARDAAQLYIDLGWEVVPLLPKSKACSDADWLNLIFKPDDFRPGDNIGLRSVNGLVVSDLDCDEAVALSDKFLSPTHAVYGRPSKLRSKRVYHSLGFAKTHAIKDVITKQTILEIRSQHQDMAPPSVHPNGELLSWATPDGKPMAAATVDSKQLLREHKLLATCVLIARYYNGDGARHEWCLALAGVMRYFMMSKDEALLIIGEAGRLAKDKKVSDRLLEVKTTYDRSDDEPVSGLKKLAETAERGKDFVACLRAVWSEDGYEFITDDHGKVLPNQENIRRALKRMNVQLFEDVFSNTLMIVDNDGTQPLTDAKVDWLWMETEKRFGFRPSYDYFMKYLQVVARMRKVHPVRDYLEGLKWDGTPRIDNWLHTYCGAKKSNYSAGIGRLVLMAAVKRVFHPGCKFDEMLILESKQGTNKSTGLRALCPNPDWFSDDFPLGADSKQVIERTVGRWVVEAAELHGIRKRESEHLKSFLSRQVDGPVRLAYGRLPVTVPRQFIIIGTTNESGYLKDVTGLRRFWPLAIKTVDVEGLRRDRDQLWAEAKAAVEAGGSVRLDPALYGAAEVQQSKRIFATVDPWRDLLIAAYPTNKKLRLKREHPWTVIGVPSERWDDRGWERIRGIMKVLGFRSLTVKIEGVVSKGWGRDPEQGVLEDDSAVKDTEF